MSRLPFELFLALRYLRPKRTFISIITFISVIGVALGVAVLIIVISVMSGFDKQLRDTVLGFNAHLTIVQVGGPMIDYHETMRRVEADKDVKGVAPFVMGKVYLETEPQTGQALAEAPVLRGVDSETEANVSFLPSCVVQGKFDVSGRGLVVGKVFADNLQLAVGDRVNIFSPRDLIRMKESRTKTEQEAVLPDEYEVRGIFDAGHYEINSSFVLVSLENAQEMYNLGENVHGLMVRLQDPFTAPAAKERLEKYFGVRYRVMTWLEQSPMLAAVMVEKNVMLYILFFIVVVAAFGITCTTITFIIMKTREIGMMKAIGASSRQVMWVFMGQSLIVSFFGILTGLGFGLLGVHYRNEFLGLMRRMTHMPILPPEIYGFSQLPMLIVPSDIFIICGGSLLMCLAAAAFPARYASRMNPVEALRYE